MLDFTREIQGASSGKLKDVEGNSKILDCMFGIEKNPCMHLHGLKHLYNRASLAFTVHLLIDSHRTESYRVIPSYTHHGKPLYHLYQKHTVDGQNPAPVDSY